MDERPHRLIATLLLLGRIQATTYRVSRIVTHGINPAMHVTRLPAHRTQISRHLMNLQSSVRPKQCQLNITVILN